MKKQEFRFRPYGYGHYYVTYFSPKTNKEWTCYTNNMPLIDATKNTEFPKIKDLTQLKKLCKQS
jgi:hypothetical protein